MRRQTAAAIFLAASITAPCDAALPFGYTTLQTLWRAKVTGSNDYFTSTDWAEVNGKNPEQLYYVIDDATAPRRGLYRVKTAADSMDQNSATPPPGYLLDKQIGHAFDLQNYPGLMGMNRLYNPTNGDHAMRGYGWSVNGAGAVQRDAVNLGGYNTEGNLGYGYPRFGSSLTHYLTMTAGSVTVSSNLESGGAIYNWIHRGKQYVSYHDNGRQMQSAYFLQYFDNQTNTFGLVNPTEAGDQGSLNQIGTRRHGSPLLSASNNVATSVQSTMAIPLEWNKESFTGGGPDNPVIAPYMYEGKNLTMNFNNMGPVARFDTILAPIHGGAGAQVEIPTLYTTGDLETYLTYSAPTNTLANVSVPVHPANPNSVQFNASAGYGGVIISSSDSQHAIGIYGAKRNVGGSVDYFTLWNFTNVNNPDPTAFDTSKWSAVFGPDTMIAGLEYKFSAWVMSGTVAEVQNLMQSLYTQQIAGTLDRGAPVLTLSQTLSQRSLVTSGNWNTAGNWSSSAIPDAASNVIINAGRTATLNTPAAQMLGSVLVGFNGSNGSLTVAAGGSLNLNGGILLGFNGSNAGTFTQTGGNVDIHGFFIGGESTGTTGGLPGAANISGGNFRSTELYIATGKAASATGSSFDVSGGSVSILGKTVLGNFGSAARLNLTGGMFLAGGDIGEGTSGTNVSTLTLDGGTLDLGPDGSNASLTVDNLLLRSGTLRNIKQINNGAAVTKTTSGSLLISGSNTFTGTLSINDGIVRVDHSAALGVNAKTVNIIGDTGTSRYPELQLAGGISLPVGMNFITSNFGDGPTGTSAIRSASGVNSIGGNVLMTGGLGDTAIAVDLGTLTMAGTLTNNNVGSNRGLRLRGAGQGVITGNIVNGSGASTVSVTKDNPGAWQLLGTNTYTAGTTVNAGTLIANRLSNGTLTINGGMAQLTAKPTAAHSSGTTFVPALQIAGAVSPSAKLDITNNALVVDYGFTSPRATHEAQIKSAYAGGNWTGNGITSKTAAESGLIETGVGIAEATDLFTSFPAFFAGVSVDASSVLMRYTLSGDADLSGSVNSIDFTRLASGYGSLSGRWVMGDFDYNGKVNTLDFNLLAGNFGATALPGASLGSMIPEPGHAIAIVGVAGWLRRRRS